MKYKVGDKIRVRKDLEVGEIYGNIDFIDLMEKYKGQIVTVISVGTAHYEIEEDNGTWAWTDEMLEPVEEGEENDMNIEKLNGEYKAKMDALMEEYKTKVKEVTKKEEPFIKEGQRYFTIDNYFRILTTKNFDCEDDAERIQIGNCYPFTDENKDKIFKEVSLIAERRKLQSEMEQFARQNNDKFDWSNNNQKKWFLYINYVRSEIIIAWYTTHKTPNVTYFTSEKIAKKALERFGSRIKKLYIDSENNY